MKIVKTWVDRYYIAKARLKRLKRQAGNCHVKHLEENVKERISLLKEIGGYEIWK